MNPEEPELPWTEEQWEKFFKQSDVRSAKYGELLETFIDHPDRDEIIDREMGWDRIEEGEFELELEAEFDPDEGEEWKPDEAPEEASERAERADFRKSPVYARAYQFGLQLHRALKPYVTPDSEEQDDDLADARINGMIIAAKLAGSMAMDHDDDTLCGAIVTCRKSSEAAAECLRALRSLRERRFAPAEVLDALIDECEAVKSQVDQHIAALRGRVWWE